MKLHKEKWEYMKRIRGVTEQKMLEWCGVVQGRGRITIKSKILILSFTVQRTGARRTSMEKKHAEWNGKQWAVRTRQSELS